MFFVFRDLTDYVLCTRIEQYSGSIFSNNFNYFYTRSCDEEPYVMVLKNINNLQIVDDRCSYFFEILFSNQKQFDKFTDQLKNFEINKIQMFNATKELKKEEFLLTKN